jgi:hypothetical protein
MSIRDSKRLKKLLRMKTNDFILQGRKPKLAIKVETKNIFCANKK